METESENTLIDWFTKHSIPVYVNRISESLHTKNKFTTTGVRYKPDLLINTKTHGWIAIEVKVGDSNRSLGESGKIINYWQDYSDKLVRYFVDGNEIIISFFAIATGHSPKGKLLVDETEFVYQDYPRHPQMEFTLTKLFCRNVFQQFRLKKNRNEIPDESAGWGVILSSALNRDSTCKPFFFSQKSLKNNIKGKYEIFLNFEELR